MDVLEVDHNLVLRMAADVYETAMNELSLNQKGVIQKKKLQRTGRQCKTYSIEPIAYIFWMVRKKTPDDLFREDLSTKFNNARSSVEVCYVVVPIRKYGKC